MYKPNTIQSIFKGYTGKVEHVFYWGGLLFPKRELGLCRQVQGRARLEKLFDLMLLIWPEMLLFLSNVTKIVLNFSGHPTFLIIDSQKRGTFALLEKRQGSGTQDTCPHFFTKKDYSISSIVGTKYSGKPPSLVNAPLIFPCQFFRGHHMPMIWYTAIRMWTPKLLVNQTLTTRTFTHSLRIWKRTAKDKSYLRNQTADEIFQLSITTFMFDPPWWLKKKNYG